VVSEQVINDAELEAVIQPQGANIGFDDRMSQREALKPGFVLEIADQGGSDALVSCAGEDGQVDEQDLRQSAGPRGAKPNPTIMMSAKYGCDMDYSRLEASSPTHPDPTLLIMPAVDSSLGRSQCEPELSSPTRQLSGPIEHAPAVGRLPKSIRGNSVRLALNPLGRSRMELPVESAANVLANRPLVSE
jgi:hypothetical protein